MADKELLREVALELWGSVKKLRPGLPRESRLELTLKALMVIADEERAVLIKMTFATGCQGFTITWMTLTFSQEVNSMLYNFTLSEHCRRSNLIEMDFTSS